MKGKLVIEIPINVSEDGIDEFGLPHFEGKGTGIIDENDTVKVFLGKIYNLGYTHVELDENEEEKNVTLN